MMIQSICIVRLSAIGDVVMLVPLVRTLQAALPQASITWVISEPAYSLVKNLDGVEFLLIDKPKSIRDYFIFKKKLRHRQFDVLLATQASFRANLLYPCISALRKIGYDDLRAKDGHSWFINEKILPGKDHTVDGFLRFAEHLGIKTPLIRWAIPLNDIDIEWVSSQVRAKKPLCLINPSASKPERNWIKERYIELIKALRLNWAAEVVLTGGPGKQEQQLATTIGQEVQCINLVGKTNPSQLLALINRADLLICPDTGPAHMAVAVQTPVIALHAVTSSAVSGPYLYRDLAVDYYSQAILKTKNAAWGTHAHGFEAMKLISVAAVLEKVALVLPT